METDWNAVEMEVRESISIDERALESLSRPMKNAELEKQRLDLIESIQKRLILGKQLIEICDKKPN